MKKKSARPPIRHAYRKKIERLLKNPVTGDLDVADSIELQSHWAKYLCVLVSGYLEQSIREIMVEYASNKSSQIITRYIDNSWPNSRNMSYGNILDILQKFESGWHEVFEKWINDKEERKGDINSLISWRNDISHGKESNTTGITIVSVKNKFNTACNLIDLIETTVNSS